jgi:hypothetical protein
MLLHRWGKRRDHFCPRWPESEADSAGELVHLRILGNVLHIINNQIQLNLLSQPIRRGLGQNMAFRRNPTGTLDALSVLPFRHFQRVQFAEAFSVSRSRAFPGLSDFGPSIAQALFIRIAILGNNCGDLL